MVDTLPRSHVVRGTAQLGDIISSQQHAALDVPMVGFEVRTDVPVECSVFQREDMKLLRAGVTPLAADAPCSGLIVFFPTQGLEGPVNYEIEGRFK